MIKLFPPFLDVGSKGVAVDVLHVFFILSDLETDELVRDGVYGEVTVELVKTMQRELGFEETDIDGNFGPKTRVAILEMTGGLNFNSIPLHETADNITIWNGPGVDQATWPPHRPEGMEDDSPDEDGAGDGDSVD